MNKEGNQRGTDTRERLTEAFLTLLSQKDISRITIQEICENAQVSRTAFYNHYEDIYDLFHKCGKEITAKAALSFFGADGNWNEYSRDGYLRLFEFIQQNRSFYLYFLRQGSLSRIIAEDMSARPGRSVRQEQYRRIFHSGAINAVLLWWLEGGCVESPEELLAIIERESRSGLLT